MPEEVAWTLYMIRCNDGSLYTGITTDVARRLQEHRDSDGLGKGAKFLRGKSPLTLVYTAAAANRSEASRLEYTVKQLTKAEKEALVNRQLTLQEVQSRNLAS
jgi:putative endonuclease